MQNFEANFSKEESSLTIFSADLEHRFGSIVGKEFENLSKREQPQKPGIAFDFVRIHFLMVYTDLVE